MAKADEGVKRVGVRKEKGKKFKKPLKPSKKSSGAERAVQAKKVKEAGPQTPIREVPGVAARAKAAPARRASSAGGKRKTPAGPRPSPAQARGFSAPELELGLRPPAAMLGAGKKVKQKIPPMDTIKKRFLKMKEDLLREVATRIESETDHRYEIGDVYDLATSERDREFSLLVGNRARQRLKEIDAALERINDKSYGICEECGQRISAGRLLAMPFTRLCVRCKEEAEKKEEEEALLEQQDEEERVYEGLEEADEFEEE